MWERPIETKMTRFLLLSVFLFGSSGVLAGEPSVAAIAEKAYVFGFPLVIMDITRDVQTDPTDGSEKSGGTNRVSHIRTFPDPAFHDFVTPNVDTLYSIAWLDLKHSPVVFSVPEMGDRYYLMQFMDAWTNVFASIGPRTTGSKPDRFLFIGPDWQGEVPDKMTHIASPTNTVWLLGRIQTNGAADYKAVHALQDGFTAMPLVADKKPSKQPKPVDTKTPPIKQADALEAVEFFSRLGMLMKDNPPSAMDAPFLKELESIGIKPGTPFDPQSLAPATWKEVQQGYAAGKRNILKIPYGIASGNWFIMPENIGRFGTDYTTRTLVARMGIGANLREDAIYPFANKDAEGNELNGKNKYEIRFAKNSLPPVRAFWSLTVYDDEHFFVVNPINRYALHGYDPLQYDPDGGLTVYLQRESPEKDKESNWLPAPEGKMNVILRLYWPEKVILDGKWPMPELRKVD